MPTTLLDKMTLLGDPHLGRKFLTGVPLERRGEREASVWQDFAQSLDTDRKIHVCLGDLFDGFVVPPEVVIKAAHLYVCAATEHPDTQYFILRGNHDASRDADKASSFDLFTLLVEGQPNIKVVLDRPLVFSTEDYEELVFVPWHPFKTPEQLVAETFWQEGEETEGFCDVLFAHWDVDMPTDPNYLPLEILKKRTSLVVTGHVHTPSVRKFGDLTVVVQGSMQPYSHAEDPGGRLYVTTTVADALINKDLYKNKAVRLVLKDDEEIPQELLSAFRALTVKDTTPVVTNIEVKTEDFDFKALFQEVFREKGVSTQLTEDLYRKYENERSF